MISHPARREPAPEVPDAIRFASVPLRHFSPGRLEGTRDALEAALLAGACLPGLFATVCGPIAPLHPSHHTQARPGSARAGVLLCRRTSHRHPTPPHHRSTLPDVDVEIALHILPHDICSLCRLLDVSNAADAVRGLPLKPAECFQAGPRIVPLVARNVTPAMTFVYVVVRRARTSLRCRRMTAS